MALVLDADAATLLREIRRRGLEGLVAKRNDFIYEAGKRSGSWMKYRINQRDEFVIGGYLPGRNFLDAVLVGRSVEAFDLLNHANFQQNAVDNVQYTTAEVGSTNNWLATLNPHFGAGLAMAPRYGSRAFQFSTRFSF